MCRDCGLASRSTSANICDWIQNKQRPDRKVILWRWHWRCFRSQPLSPTLLLWLWVLRWEPNNIELACQRKGRVTSGHRAGRQLWIEGLSVRVSVKIQRHQRWEKVKQGWPRIPLSSQGYFMAQCFCSRKQAPCLWIKTRSPSKTQVKLDKAFLLFSLTNRITYSFPLGPYCIVHTSLTCDPPQYQLYR